MAKNELEQITTELKICSNCDLHKNRKNVVVGNGVYNAKIMVVGEAPGAKEDDTGVPFAGDAGETLGELLSKASVERKDCYITNRIKCRPPENRDPKQSEIMACQKYLDKEIEAVKPSVILLVGEKAANLVSSDKMENIHGKEFTYKNIPAFVVYHPSGLNNKYINQREEDFHTFGEFLKNLKGGE